MFINYKGTNVHALPFVTYKEVRLKNKKTGKVRVIQQVDNSQNPREIHSLKPGWNQFPTHIWKQNEGSPSIQQMLKKKVIELMAVQVEIKQRTPSGKIKKIVKLVGQDDKPVKLKYFNEVDSVKIVKSTFNREMLQEWLDEERRHRVKKVLAKQLEPLLSKTGTEDDDDDEGFSDVG
jgi:hypothetical protein